MSAEVATEVAVRAATSGCLHEEGQLTRYETTTVPCADGSVLHWNEAGWGYDGSTWHPRQLNQIVPVPPEERSSCKPVTDTDDGALAATSGRAPMLSS